jgi:CAAX protease family protein
MIRVAAAADHLATGGRRISGSGMSEEPSQRAASPAVGKDRMEQALVILAVLAFPAPVPHGTWWLLGSALAWSGLLMASVAERWPLATRITTLAGLGMVIRLSLPRLWPGLVPLAVAFAIALLLARPFPVLRPLMDLPTGSFDRKVLWSTAAVVALAAGAIAAWAAVVGPAGYSEGTRLAIQQARIHPFWVVAPLGALFAAANAAAEEVFFRGAFMAGLTEVAGLAIALAIQAASFGLLHLAGFPSGWVGVALAAAYGTMLGLLRIQSRGLMAPWVAHSLADLAIISVIVWVAK